MIVDIHFDYFTEALFILFNFFSRGQVPWPVFIQDIVTVEKFSKPPIDRTEVLHTLKEVGESIIKLFESFTRLGAVQIFTRVIVYIQALRCLVENLVRNLALIHNLL